MYTRSSFYSSKVWANFRLGLMQERTNEDGLLICEHCGKPILKRYDCIAHHKIELTEENVNDFEISLNPENIALIHLRCHNEEHERFEGKRQQVWIVYGAPCSGKTTFVKLNAHEDDLILDMDAIFRMISGCERYDKPKRLAPVAFAVRDAILEAIKLRKGFWRNAWIITTKTWMEIARDAEIYRAEPIHIDTEQTECIKRLTEHPNGRDVTEWTRYIEEYFEREAAGG